MEEFDVRGDILFLHKMLRYEQNEVKMHFVLTLYMDFALRLPKTAVAFEWAVVYGVRTGDLFK